VRSKTGKRQQPPPRSHSAHSDYSVDSLPKRSAAAALARQHTEVFGPTEEGDLLDEDVTRVAILAAPPLRQVTFFDDAPETRAEEWRSSRRADAAGAVAQIGAREAHGGVSYSSPRRRVAALDMHDDAALSTDGEDDDDDDTDDDHHHNNDDDEVGEDDEAISPVLFTAAEGASEQRTSPLDSAGTHRRVAVSRPLGRRALLLLRRSRKRRPPLIDVTLQEFEECVQNADAL
jgi:hypothetical protein